MTATPETLQRIGVVASEPGRKAVLIGAARYRRHSYGDNHPLGIPRVSLTVDLIRSFGALTEAEYRVSRKATLAELRGFHTEAYLTAIQRCEAMGKVSDTYRRRHNFGNLENPYFPGFFSVPATAAGGSIQGAEEVLAGHVAFSPAGGMHHARPDQARGFCFLNDPVLAIRRLRREGLRVLYLDIDAHHGDGVEEAFRSDPQVLTMSFHMDTRYAYPFEGGAVSDRGGADNAVNVPLPRGTHDGEYRLAFHRLWPAVMEAFRPEVVVVQAGTDMLLPDPLGKFDISTQWFLALVEQVLTDCPSHEDGTPRLLVLGGGGYHPLTLARCWTGVWALLSGRELPGAIPPDGQALLRAVDWDQDEDEDYFESLFVSRYDPVIGGEIRPEIPATVDRLLNGHPLFRATRD
ncbi:MAG: acetoin utilization protein AcuC [Gammaproteobacteria bacterium]